MLIASAIFLIYEGVEGKLRKTVVYFNSNLSKSKNIKKKIN